MTIATSTKSSSLYTMVLGITCAASGCTFDDHVEPSDHLKITEQALESSTPPYMFPSRGLEPGHYWRVDEWSEGEYTLDLDVVRWDDELDRWAARKDGIDIATYNADKTNDKHLSYGLPLYAPVDGRIISCWRNFPDNPAPGVKLDAVTGANLTTRSIFASGNHVAIETAEGKVMLLAHFQPGTIPSSLCPFNATSASVYKPPGSNFPAASFIEEADRPLVRRGDFLGRSGNSGNSSGPHVHVDVRPLIGSKALGAGGPIPWFATWAQPYELYTPIDDQAWYELDNEPATATAGNTLFWPSPFLRRGSATEYGVHDLDSVAIPGIGVLTAARDAAGDLQVSSFGVSADGEVGELFTDSAGEIGAVEVARPSSGRDVVVGVRTASGALKLIYWKVATTGGLDRMGSATDVAITDLDLVMVPAGGTGVVTASRMASGQVQVTGWHTSSSDGTITRAGSDNGPYASAVRATAITDGRTAAEEGQPARFQGVVTASIANGDLRLDTFRVTSSKGIEHRDYEIAGPVMSVAIGTVRVSSTRELVVTAIRSETGYLKLIAWEIESNGAIHRLGSIYAGAILSDIEIQSGGTGALITAVKLTTGNLKLLSWELTSDGELRRLGDHLAGEAQAISLGDRVVRGRRTYVTTPVRLTGNALKVIAFETNL